jgi:hypothetical protein
MRPVGQVGCSVIGMHVAADVARRQCGSTLLHTFVGLPVEHGPASVVELGGEEERHDAPGGWTARLYEARVRPSAEAWLLRAFRHSRGPTD